MSQRRIRVFRHPATAAERRGSLLFVHGGYVNSQCWEFNFIPFFRRQGYDCFAVDLSGHGESEGRERIDDFGLDDYAEDVALALREIDGPVVVVGHSMGTLVLERYLEKGDAAAAILLAPVPPTGTAGSAWQLTLRYPNFLLTLDDAVSGRMTDEGTRLMADIYFSPATETAELLRFLPMIGPESGRAVAEMALLQARPRRQRTRLPVLVIGGTEDAVFPASMLHFSALPWNAEVYRAEGAGHMLMLDSQWQNVAKRMLAWMASLELVQQPA